MNDGYFYRLYYSDEYGTSKGLFLGFELQQVSIEKYFNKLKCGFNTNGNSNIIGFIKAIENISMAFSKFSTAVQSMRADMLTMETC